MTDDGGLGQAASRGLLLGLAALALVLPVPALQVPSAQSARAAWPGADAPDVRVAAPHLAPHPEPHPEPHGAPHRRPNFGAHAVSPEARHLAAWVADSGDNLELDFVIVDKRQARVWVFDAAARLQAATAALLGSARGDDSVPGIGSRPIADVKPEVRNTEARERRLRRLATPTAADNRISYGCINLPVAFYEQQIRPRVATQRVIVYVLPEVKPLQPLFGSYRVADLRTAH